MPIHIILGKPGSGKSRYATDKLIDQLRETKRNIVTNLPIRPERLNEYLQRKYPNDDLRMPQRLRILTDDELSKFWTFRGPESPGSFEPPPLPAFSWSIKEGESPEDEWNRYKYERGIYTQRGFEHERQWMHYRNPGGDPLGSEGVCYILDECHIAFNARDWANIGRGALHYLSQHRKLGDVVFPITQAPGNLDKQFRSVAEDFTVLRNEYTATYGIFKGRGRFVRRSYNSEPQNNAEPFEVATFTLDPDGVASCYDTAKGIGVHGSKADIGRRAKGISIMWVIPAFLLAASLCVLVPWMLGKGASNYLGKAVGTAKAVPAQSKGAAPESGAKKAPAANPDPQELANLPPPSNGLRPQEDASSPSAPPSAAGALWVTGYVVRGSRINVTLSDGRTLTEEDGELVRVGRNFVDLKDGRRLWIRSSRPTATATAFVLPPQQQQAPGETSQPARRAELPQHLQSDLAATVQASSPSRQAAR